MDSWVVLKFGGSSVATPVGWATVVRVTRARLAEGHNVLLVVSALRGVSDLLERAEERAREGSHEPLVSRIVEMHQDLASALGAGGEDLAPLFDELRRTLHGIALLGESHPALRARIMALGERLSSSLGLAYLKREGLDAALEDARDLLVSTGRVRESDESHFLRARVDAVRDADLVRRLQRRPLVVLTQGFIARDAEGRTVLLGRGGSDTSASTLAAKLGAVRVEIWTDVPGLFSSDPKIVPEARLIRSVDYAEAQELATQGAGVLHPRCIRPVREQRIPLWVRSTFRPDMEGTVVAAEPPDPRPRLKAICLRRSVTLVSVESLDMWHEPGFLARIFGIFSAQGISVDLVSTSETNVTLSLDAPGDAGGRALEAALDDLAGLGRVRVIRDAACISLVGRRIRAILGRLGPALDVLSEEKVYLVSQAANDLNFAFVVDEGPATRLVRDLHASLIHASPEDPVFGPTWAELEHEPGPAGAPAPIWWEIHREALLQLGAGRGHAYVYHLATVRDAARRLKAVRSVDRFYYAVKANDHPEILRCLLDEGFGFECVSEDELRHVRATLPSLEMDRVLFTPNFAPRAEYEEAVRLGARLVVDNLHPLKWWPELFRGREILLRLDPGRGRGHHPHVRTGGRSSKFGIGLDSLAEVEALLNAAGARVAGVHAHIGSGILDPSAWAATGAVLVEAARRFPEARILNLGGGLGVPSLPGQRPLDLERLDRGLSSLRSGSSFEVWLEPGRYLVADAGVLVARVTQVKRKGEATFVGVATGMNSFLRPALYGAYHEIVNLTRLHDPPECTVHVVGPICESADRLGADRRLPRCKEGDVLLVTQAGAYGRVMASRYNRRPPSEEWCVDDAGVLRPPHGTIL